MADTESVFSTTDISGVRGSGTGVGVGITVQETDKIFVSINYLTAGRGNMPDYAELTFNTRIPIAEKLYATAGIGYGAELQYLFVNDFFPLSLGASYDISDTVSVEARLSRHLFDPGRNVVQQRLSLNFKL